MSLSLRLSKKLKEDKLGQTIKEFRDKLKSLKAILNKIKELGLFREQEINEIKNETKRESNMLDDETSKILEKLDVDLTTLRLKCKFFEKPSIAQLC